MKASKLALRIEQTGKRQDDNVQRFSDLTRQAVNGMPWGAGGVWLKGISLAAFSDNKIPHGLGRPVQGYIVTKVTNDVYTGIFKDTDPTLQNSYFTIHTQIACTVDIWVW